MPQNPSIPQQAMDYFLQGYNCSQAVAAAFAPRMGLTAQQAAKTVSALGGGLCRMRETCGAVTGGMAVLGMIVGYDDPQDTAGKTQLYIRGQRVMRAFRELHGSLSCREILHLAPGESSDPAPTPRTAEFYSTRPCARVIYDLARLLEEELNDPKKG